MKLSDYPTPRVDAVMNSHGSFAAIARQLERENAAHESDKDLLGQEIAELHALLNGQASGMVDTLDDEMLDKRDSITSINIAKRYRDLARTIESANKVIAAQTIDRCAQLASILIGQNRVYAIPDAIRVLTPEAKETTKRPITDAEIQARFGGVSTTVREPTK